MRRLSSAHALCALALLCSAGAVGGQEHRAEQDREITYWLHEPSTGRFRISHDFTVTTPGQRFVHNFVRAGSEVSDPSFHDLDTGRQLQWRQLTGAAYNALGLGAAVDPDAVVVQAELTEPLREGHSVRIRVIETYTDRGRYYLEAGELVWDRTLGRPRNVVILPPGWRLTALSVPATIDLDAEGRVRLRFVNPRNDALHVVIRGRARSPR